MNTINQRIASLLILTLMAQMLLGCASISTTPPEGISAPNTVETPNPDYANAQATIDSGQSQLLDLSGKATEASLNMSQAANAAAQSTQEYNQRQKMDLDSQETIVSLNIAQAAATQKFITQQTKIARDATAAAQRSAATSTQSAYLQAQAILDAQALQTAQAVAVLTAYPLTATYSAQVILNAQATQAAQANATLTAYPLTATPFAATQAALLMQEYDREQQAFVDRVVAPLIPILATLVLLLFIVLVIVAYRRSMPRRFPPRWFPPRWIPPVPWPRRLHTKLVNDIPGPLNMIDGVIADHHLRLHRAIPLELTPANPPSLPDENTFHVEIVNAAEPPVAHWIAEVEHQLAAEAGQSL